MESVRLIKPYIEYEEIEAEFREVFESGIFTQGSNTREFAQKIGALVGSKYTFLSTSATTALWLSLKALSVRAGDEVAISDFSFPATANVVEDLGAKPIFVDVNLDTFNMDADNLAAKITSKTKAVIFVDAFGNPTGLHDVKKICEQYSLPLIEDAACAIGSSEFGIPCGDISDITCFSFHPRKLLCTGEGGAITTNNEDWALWLESKLLHGASKNSAGAMEFTNYGFNFRMSELQAVMGLKQIEKIPKIIDQRTKSRDTYKAEIEPMGFKAQHSGPSTVHNLQSLVFTVPETIERDILVNYLKTKSIETTIGTYCQSNLPYYRAKYNDVQPNATLLERRTITLPCYENFPIERVCEYIKVFSDLYQNSERH